MMCDREWNLTQVTEQEGTLGPPQGCSVVVLGRMPGMGEPGIL